MVINRHTNIKTEHESDYQRTSTSIPPQDAHETSKGGGVSTITFFVVKPYIINPLFHEQTWGSARAMMGWVLLLWGCLVTKGRFSSLGKRESFSRFGFNQGTKKAALNSHYKHSTEPPLTLATR